MNREYNKKTDGKYLKKPIYQHANWYLRSMSGDVLNGDYIYENLYRDIGLIYFFGSFDSISYNTDYIGVVCGFEL